MTKRYLLKINGNTSGPFDEQKVRSFIVKGKLSAIDQIKLEDQKSWVNVSNINEFKDFFPNDSSDSTSFISLTELESIKNKINTDESEQEPTENNSDDLPDIAKDPVAVEEAKEQVQEEVKENPIENNKTQQSVLFNEFKFSRNAQDDFDYSQINREFEQNAKAKRKRKPAKYVEAKTVIKRPQKVLNVDKTLVIRPLTKKEMTALEQSVSEGSGQVKEEIDPKSLVDTNEKTILLNSDDFNLALVKEIKESEKEILHEIKKFEDEHKVKDEEESKSKIVEIKQATRKGMKPIVAFAFVVILAFLLFDEDKKIVAFNPQYFTLSKIYSHEFMNKAKSEALYEKALEEYRKGTYLNKIKTIQFLKESLANHTENKKSLGLIILTYSEILDNVKNKRTAKHNFNILLRINESRLLKDPNVAVGAALFFSYYKKHESSVRTLKNYLRLGKKNQKVLSTYLRVLIKAEKLEESREAFEILNKIEKKTLDTYLALSQFYEYDENYLERNILLKESLKTYPSSVALLLELADTQFNLQDMKGFALTLKKIEALRAEQSPIFYAKFMEYIGLAAGINGKNNKAVLAFKESLRIFENDVLRSRLAALEAGGSSATENLILESKSVKLMDQARKEMEQSHWEKAFMHAIDAADMLSTYIPAQLLLAEIQTRRGYFERAITTLLKLKSENPTDLNINTMLITSFIKARRFEDAQEHITMLSRDKKINFSKTPEFASLQGRLFYAKDAIPQAIEHLKKSVVLDPLNDADYFLLAKIFLKHRQYARAKATLSNALKLEPENVEYRSAYAKILYELDSVNTAIGYLKKFLDKNPDNAKILGEIATYHYLNGDSKEFKRYKKMVEDQPVRDKSFYQFMIGASKLENNTKEIIKYAHELIKIEPGDLETRLLLGEYLFKQGRHSNAEEIFKGITERLPSYPKVHYYLGKIYLELKRNEDALKAAQAEIKNNPELTFGYYVAGRAYMNMKNYPDAVKELEKAISKDGQSVEALIALGEIRLGQNFLDSALQLYLRAKRHSPSTAIIYKQLGYIYRRMGQSGLAIENFQVYLNRSPLAQDRDEVESLVKTLK